MNRQPLQYDMTPDDLRYWETVQRWKAKRLESTPRQLVPASWREKVARAGTTARERVGTAAEKVPNADKFARALKNALEGLTDAGARAGAATVRHDAVVKAYRKKGYDVAAIATIRHLQLTEIQDVKPRLDLAYVAGSAVQGAGTGLLASGGTIIAAGGAVGTGGVAAAPGVGAVITAMAADAAATIVTSNRAVAHVAAYYGYDVEDPTERVFALGVLSMGLAEDAGKVAAYAELNRIVQALARRQAWKQLNRNQVTNVVRGVYAALGMNLTKRKLAQAVPVLGVAVGAGLNARALARVIDDAEHLYMERFLRERYSIPVDAIDELPATGLVDTINAEIVADEPAEQRDPDRE